MIGNLRNIIVSILVLLAITACSSKDSEGETKTIEIEILPETTSIFVGLSAQGIGYTCSSSLKGITNNESELICKLGDDVILMLGNIVLGEVPANSYISSYALFPSDLFAVLNLVKLLVVLDIDQDLSNGIVIDNTQVELLPQNLTFTSQSFVSDVEIALSMTLISDTEAKKIMDEEIIDAFGALPIKHIPTADAGSDQNVETGSDVHLSAQHSSDSDGDMLTFKWNLVSKPNGSMSILQNDTTVTPNIVSDVDGLYVVELRVNDGNLNSSQDVVVITASTTNLKPTANASNDQMVLTNDTVTLDGSQSYDSNGDQITYSWQKILEPSQSNVSLSSSTDVKPNFTPTIAGTYLFELIVNDTLEDSASDMVVINVSSSNSAPNADAGVSQNISIGSTVVLDGSLSSDQNGDSLLYTWDFIYKPSGSSSVLNENNISSPQFIADTDGTYLLQLVVNDGQVSSAISTVSIIVTTANSEPVAHAGVDQFVNLTTSIDLNGTNSSDAENDPLNYTWSILSKPNGSNIVLSDPSLAMPSFMPDITGDYVFQLVVNDGKLNSQHDNVTITAMEFANTTPIVLDTEYSDSVNIIPGNIVDRFSIDFNKTGKYTLYFDSLPTGTDPSYSYHIAVEVFNDQGVKLHSTQLVFSLVATGEAFVTSTFDISTTGQHFLKIYRTRTGVPTENTLNYKFQLTSSTENGLVHTADKELNDVISQAAVLNKAAFNMETKGSVNITRLSDLTDWYKLSDLQLGIHVMYFKSFAGTVPNNFDYGMLTIYDQYGNIHTRISDGFTGINDNAQMRRKPFEVLIAGDYYVKVEREANLALNYSFKALDPTDGGQGINVDSEPNDEQVHATQVDLNTPVTTLNGSVNIVDIIDSDDWYTFISNETGTATITATNVAGTANHAAAQLNVKVLDEYGASLLILPANQYDLDATGDSTSGSVDLVNGKQYFVHINRESNFQSQYKIDIAKP